MSAELRIVEDVPAAFAELATDLRPSTFALSGGGTAARCYRELGRLGGDWSATTFLLSDERWVDVEHPDSNEGQARREWLEHVAHGPVHSLRGAGADLEDAAERYDRLVERLRPIDLLHLGLGEDGHTASLFPGAPTLDVDDRYVVPAGDEAHDWPRLSFTYPAIAACRTVVVTVSGQGKRAALERVQRGDPTMPATHVRAPRVLWLADEAAAPAA